MAQHAPNGSKSLHDATAATSADHDATALSTPADDDGFCLGGRSILYCWPDVSASTLAVQPSFQWWGHDGPAGAYAWRSLPPAMHPQRLPQPSHWVTWLGPRVLQQRVCRLTLQGCLHSLGSTTACCQHQHLCQVNWAHGTDPENCAWQPPIFLRER